MTEKKVKTDAETIAELKTMVQQRDTIIMELKIREDERRNVANETTKAIMNAARENERQLIAAQLRAQAENAAASKVEKEKVDDTPKDKNKG